MSTLVNVAEVGSQRRRLALEALFALVQARLARKSRSFKRVVEGMERSQESGVNHPVRDDQAATACLVRWAIIAVSKRLPWTATCLEQAIAARKMLAKRRIPGTLQIGLEGHDPSDARAFEAHAWTTVGDVVVTDGQLITGETGHEQYSVLARYRWN